MSIWTQKSALIQLRTSLLKFDDLAEIFEKSSVSNFSTKAIVARFGAILLLASVCSALAALGFIPALLAINDDDDPMQCLRRRGKVYRQDAANGDSSNDELTK